MVAHENKNGETVLRFGPREWLGALTASAAPTAALVTMLWVWSLKLERRLTIIEGTQASIGETLSETRDVSISLATLTVMIDRVRDAVSQEIASNARRTLLSHSGSTS